MKLRYMSDPKSSIPFFRSKTRASPSSSMLTFAVLNCARDKFYLHFKVSTEKEWLKLTV